MTVKNRIAKLERGFVFRDAPCPDHEITFIVTAGQDPEPEESEIPLCSKCGRAGNVLILEHVIITSRAAPEDRPER